VVERIYPLSENVFSIECVLYMDISFVTLLSFSGTTAARVGDL